LKRNSMVCHVLVLAEWQEVRN